MDLTPIDEPLQRLIMSLLAEKALKNTSETAGALLLPDWGVETEPPLSSFLDHKVIRNFMFAGEDMRFEEIPDPCPATCQWIFDDATDNGFASWLSSRDPQDKVYYIFGQAGSGKTVLMKHIVGEIHANPSLLQTEAEVHADGRTPLPLPVVISHFLDDGKGTEEQHRDIAQSLLLQLFKKIPASAVAAGQAVAASCARGSKDEKELQVADLVWSALESALMAVPATHFLHIFLDGSGLFAEYRQLVATLVKSPSVKICISCRPGDDQSWDCNAESPKSASSLRLEAHAETDLATFCRKQLEDLPEDDRALHISEILRTCKGSFRDAQAACYNVMYDFHKCAVIEKELDDRESTFHPRCQTPRWEYLQKLAFYTNLVLAHEKYNFQKARNGRPITVLELALCDYLASGEKFDRFRDVHIQLAGSTADDWLEVSRTASELSITLRHDYAPFFEVRRILNADTEYFEQKLLLPRGPESELVEQMISRALDSANRRIRSHSQSTVVLAYPGLRWFLKNTDRGKAIMQLDEEDSFWMSSESRRMLKLFYGRRRAANLAEAKLIPSEKDRKFRQSANRLVWLLNASLHEHILLMPKAIAEDANPPEEQECQGEEESCTTSERTYHPYQAHLDFAQTLPGLESLDEDELFPMDWVREYSIAEDPLYMRRVLARGVVRRAQLAEEKRAKEEKNKLRKAKLWKMVRLGF